MIFLFAAMTAAAKLHQPRMPVIFLQRLDILCVCDGLFHQFLLGIQRRQAVVNAFIAPFLIHAAGLDVYPAT